MRLRLHQLLPFALLLSSGMVQVARADVKDERTDRYQCTRMSSETTVCYSQHKIETCTYNQGRTDCRIDRR